MKDKELISYHKENDRIKLCSDGTQFFINIIAGHAETFLTVGYSCPNYAYRKGDYKEGEGLDAMIKEIKESFDEMVTVEFDDMLPIMYEKL